MWFPNLCHVNKIREILSTGEFSKRQTLLHLTLEAAPRRKAVGTRQSRKTEKMQGAWKEKGALVPGSQLHLSLAESQKYQHNRQITEDSLQGQSLSLRKMSSKTFIRSRTCLRPECVHAMVSVHQLSCPICKPNQALYKAPHNMER